MSGTGGSFCLRFASSSIECRRNSDRRITLGEADEQIIRREAAGDNSYSSSDVTALAGLAAYPYGVSQPDIEDASNTVPYATRVQRCSRRIKWDRRCYAL